MATQKIRNAANDGWVSLGGAGSVSLSVVIPSLHGNDVARESYAGGTWGAAFVATGASYCDWVDNVTPANGTGGGLIFRNVPVPKDATITAAQLSVQSMDINNDDMTMNIWGELSPNCDTYATTATMAGRSKTTATTFWNDTSTGVHVDTVADVTDIVQEIVEQASWAAGNRLGFIAEPSGTGNNGMRFETMRSISVLAGAETSQLPRLEIDFTVAAA